MGWTHYNCDCAGIAILRHRLYDIAVIINRTLVYGALSAGVAGLYVLLVGALGAFFQSSGNLTELRRHPMATVRSAAYVDEGRQAHLPSLGFAPQNNASGIVGNAVTVPLAVGRAQSPRSERSH